jgi:pimeloyl-[acyl-carrier protein] methyl ester esterase
VNRTWVLLPGLDGTGLLFEPFAAALKAQGQEVVVLTYPDQAWGYERLYQWLKTELTKVPEGAILLAESFAGPLGVMLAAGNAQRFSKLVMCASFVRCPSAIANVFAPTLNWLNMFTPFVSLLSNAMPKMSVEQGLFNGQLPAELRTQLATVLKQSRAEVSNARLIAILNVDVRAQLKAVNIPTLYLQATQDRLVGTHSLDEIKRIKPDVQVERFNAPHCLLQVSAQEVVGRLLQSV